MAKGFSTQLRNLFGGDPTDNLLKQDFLARGVKRDIRGDIEGSLKRPKNNRRGRSPKIAALGVVSLGLWTGGEMIRSTEALAALPLVTPPGQSTPDVRPVPDPNRDRDLQPLPDPTPLPTGPGPLDSEPIQLDPGADPDAEAIRFRVDRIEVTGSTLFTRDDLLELIQPLEGRDVTLRELQQLADSITQRYLDGGYITSRALVPEQTIDPGSRSVEIRVIEGSLEDIKIEGLDRLNERYVRSRVELGAGTPLNTTELEDQLRLLRSNPLLDSLEASIRPGEGAGKSILIVRVAEAEPFGGNVGVDNYSPPSVGSERFSVNLFHRNLTGNGDLISLGYNRTLQGGTDVLDFNYRIPLNPMDGTLQVRVAPNWNRIIQEEFEELEIRGQSQLYELSFRQPLVRTPRNEFALSLGLTYQTGQTFVFNDIGTPFGLGPDENGISTTAVVKFGQDYIRRDPRGAWSLRSLFNIGTSLFDATDNDGDLPDGQFFSWTGSIQRVQRLSDRHLLIMGINGQLSTDPLLSSQQFVIGGGQSVRGFRQNARSADNGFRAFIEDRITLAKDSSGLPELILSPFFDAGYVWNHADNPNPLPDQRFLAGVGLGLTWLPVDDFVIRLDYAIPL
ncbi:MAG: ShlB/FhaC/HecB family hemolysin secretion/activation protein, partial [Cyanobacteria bacterium P01_F01_bin.153]